MTKAEITKLARAVTKEVRDYLKAEKLVPPSPTAGHDAPSEFAKYIDHTLLKPEATETQIRAICAEARDYGFASVCVNSYWVTLCKELLHGSGVDVTSVIGFPLGAMSTAAKVFETRQAIQDGANEIDMVLSIGLLKAGDLHGVSRDIAAVATDCHNHGALLKVIFENGFLTEDEKIKACAICLAANVDYVKTSTGFGPGGATPEDVALMRAIVGDKAGVKAAGGVRTYADAQKMIQAGASRLGASAGVRLVQEAQGQHHAPPSTTSY